MASNAVIGALRVDLGMDSAQFGRDAKKAQGTLAGLGKSFASVGTMLAGALSTAAIGAAVQNAVAAYAEFDRAQRTMQATLEATGFAAGRTREQLENLARDVGFESLASTEGVRNAIAQLLTFKSVQGDTFDRTIRAAQDLAAVGFGTLESSTVQLGKALEDPINGLTALRRVGVSFTADQRELIRGFVEMGRVADAQRVILEAVEGQVGGAGNAAGGGLAGAFDGLSEEIAQTTRRAGAAIAEFTRLGEVVAGVTAILRSDNLRADGGLRGTQEEIRLTTQALGELRAQYDRLTRGRVSPSGAALEEVRRLEAAIATQEARLRGMRQAENAYRVQDAHAEIIVARRAEAAAAQEQAQRIGDVMGALNEEIAAASRSAAENMARARITEAGVALDSAEAQAIRAKVFELDRLTASTGAAASQASRVQEEMRAAGEAVFESTRTPLEALNAEMTRLGELVQAGAINQDTYSRAVKQAQDAFSEAQLAGNDFAQTLEGSINSAFDSILQGTFDLGKTLRAFANDVARMFFRRGVSALMDGIFGSVGGKAGAPLNLASFITPRAMGGPIAAGSPYLVGERGPELIVPRAAGTVIPNHDLMGAAGGGNVQVNIINNAKTDVRTRERQTAGGKTLDVIVDEMVADKIGTPGSASRRALQANGGLSPQLARR